MKNKSTIKNEFDMKRSVGGNTIVYIDSFIPEDSKYRIYDKLISSLNLEDKLKDYYNKYGVGRTGYNPLTIMRVLFLKEIDNFSSIRETCERIKTDIGCKWFIGLGINDNTPTHTTISNAICNRYPKEFFVDLFSEFMNKSIEEGIIKASDLYVDSTHTKASANIRKISEIVCETANKVTDDIMEEISQNYEGKIKITESSTKEKKTKKVSKTDPDAGIFKKEGHRPVVAYKTQVICDDNGIALSLSVTSGNIHDSTGFKEVYENLPEKIKEEANSISGDSAYGTGEIIKQTLNDDIKLYSEYPERGKKSEISKKDFEYDKEKDQYICPQGKILEAKSVDKTTGIIQYRSKTRDCKNCPLKDKCIGNQYNVRIITRKIYEKYIEIGKELRNTEDYENTYKKRKHKIEPLFGLGKEKHGLRQTTLRGLRKVKNAIHLCFLVINMKKIAKLKAI